MEVCQRSDGSVATIGRAGDEPAGDRPNRRLSSYDEARCAIGGGLR